MINHCTKLKALIGASLLTVGLGGCASETAGWQIDAAEKICAKRGGIDSLRHVFEASVTCEDGFHSRINAKE